VGNFYIWTVGCQMNTSDARMLTEELETYGFRPTEAKDSADLVVLYSCMVRQHAEDKVHSQLGELRLLKRDRKGMKIALAGCIGNVEWWQQKYPFVDFFLSPGQDLTVRDKLVDLIDLDEFYRHEPEGAVRSPVGHSSVVLLLEAIGFSPHAHIGPTGARSFHRRADGWRLSKKSLRRRWKLHPSRSIPMAGEESS
jgi:hypothetical protein